MAAPYQLTSDPNVIMRVSDGAFIPMAAGNSDYQAYQNWLASNAINAPMPAPVAPTPALTAAMALSRLTLTEFSAVMKTWVAAGAITPARSTTILTP
jgi:hypothetical protein